MADYYSVLAHAVSKLPNNNARTRRDLYERARGILIEKLSNDPGLAVKTAQELAELDTAIRRVEAETPSASMRPVPTRPRTNRAATTRNLILYLLAGIAAVSFTAAVYFVMSAYRLHVHLG
jgi:hypothetical protein